MLLLQHFTFVLWKPVWAPAFTKVDSCSFSGILRDSGPDRDAVAVEFDGMSVTSPGLECCSRASIRHTHFAAERRGLASVPLGPNVPFCPLASKQLPRAQRGRTRRLQLRALAEAWQAANPDLAWAVPLTEFVLLVFCVVRARVCVCVCAP